MKTKNPSPTKPVISGYIPGAIGKITALHGEYYHKHWKFGLFFESKVATELSDLLTGENSNRNRFWVASIDDEIVGGIAIDGNQADSHRARLRFLIVSPGCMGKGIGGRLIKTALTFCKKSRFKSVYLTTFDGLDAARHLYEKSGFQLITEQDDNTWGVTVKEQFFEKVL